MPPITGVGQDNFSFKLGDLMNRTSQKAQEQQISAAPVQTAPVAAPIRSEAEAANIAYGNTMNTLENGQQTASQTSHALDPARVAALLEDF